MTDEVTTCAALLHDVAEDTDITLEALAEMGFDSEILAILRLLTHDEAVPYMEYVRKIKTNPLAVQVKLADLRHNSDLTRLDEVDEKALRRVEKYREAIKILTE
jgi:(p)ppGpp synthase/HD superfamily hydrolase